MDSGHLTLISAGNPILEWFPSFGPMQFAVGSASGLIIFQLKTRTRNRTA